MTVETLSAQLSQYLKHGALWHTLFPLRQQLLTQHTFVGFFDQPTFPDDATIEAQFKLWSDLVDDQKMMQDYHQKLEEFQLLAPTEQYQLCIHGKRFWGHVVYPVLKEIFKQLNGGRYIREPELKNRLFQHIVYPQDMLDFVDKLSQSIEI